MNSLYTTLLAAICFVLMQLAESNSKVTSNSLNGGRAKRHLMSTYGDADGPIILNHLLKQPILSFGPWFSPSRSKRFNSVDYSDVDAFYPQPVTQRRLRRALRQHKRMVLKI